MVNGNHTFHTIIVLKCVISVKFSEGLRGKSFIVPAADLHNTHDGDTEKTADHRTKYKLPHRNDLSFRNVSHGETQKTTNSALWVSADRRYHMIYQRQKTDGGMAGRSVGY